jgi:hypothetical protein
MELREAAIFGLRERGEYASHTSATRRIFARALQPNAALCARAPLTLALAA